MISNNILKNTTMITKTYSLSGVTCPHCVKKVQNVLSDVRSINSVRISDDMQKITIESNGDISPESVNKLFEEIGDYKIHNQ